MNATTPENQPQVTQGRGESLDYWIGRAAHLAAENVRLKMELEKTLRHHSGLCCIVDGQIVTPTRETCQCGAEEAEKRDLLGALPLYFPNVPDERPR